MPTSTIRVDSDLLQRIEAAKPSYLSTTGFFQLLAEQGLDSSFIVGKPAASQGRAVLPSKAVNKEREERAYALSLEEINKPLEEDAANYAKAVKAAAQLPPPGFEAFWKTYQSCPIGETGRVRSQSKPKAKEEYKKALKTHSAAELLKAAQNAVDGQLDAQRRGEWASSLPDAFRWLKDGKYIAMLEVHAPAQAESKGDWL